MKKIRTLKTCYRYEGPSEKSKPPLVIDDEIALWLMRMIIGEGGGNCSYHKASCLLWAIVNRWFLRPGSRFYPDFVSMMRAFSQPINPKWMLGGKLALKYAGCPEASEARLKRRDDICKMHWTDIPWSIRADVAAFSECKVAYPWSGARNRCSNWASLPSTPKKFPWGHDVDGDWFFEDSNLIPGIVSVEVERKIP